MGSREGMGPPGPAPCGVLSQLIRRADHDMEQTEPKLRPRDKGRGQVPVRCLHGVQTSRFARPRVGVSAWAYPIQMFGICLHSTNTRSRAGRPLVGLLLAGERPCRDDWT